MNHKKVLIVIGLIAALLVGGFMLKKPADQAQSFLESLNRVATTSLETGTAKENKKNTDSDPRYINPNFAFSFLPPTGYTVATFRDNDTSGSAVTTVLLQAKAGADKQANNNGLQILISAWDETPEALTVARIQKDIPTMKITNSSTRDIKNIGTVIEFESNNANFSGKSYETWFVAHNDLYQISTYSENRGVVSEILSTWNFQGQ